MISRCPSCGAPAPDEARQCRACGWDFVANKKGEKKPEPGPDKPKAAPPPAAGFSLPPARGGAAEVPSAGLGMAKLPKAEPAAGPGAPDENPFALPVARNLGPKPGESLFAPPPSPPEAKLPEAKPKPEPAADAEPAPLLPPAKPKRAPEPEPEAEEEAEEEPPPPPKKKEPPKKEPQREIERPKKAEPAPEPAVEEEEEGEADPSAALFLPSSTKEIVVEPAAKRAKPDAREPEKVAPAEAAPATAGDAKPKTGRPSAVYLAALAGGVLGLFSVGAIFMMIRSEPPVAARPTGSSPFGKRAAGDSTMTPVLDDADAPPSDSLPPRASPAPAAPSDAPPPTSLPAPALSRPGEPPSPGGAVSAQAPAPAGEGA